MNVWRRGKKRTLDVGAMESRVVRADRERGETAREGGKIEERMGKGTRREGEMSKREER